MAGLADATRRAAAAVVSGLGPPFVRVGPEAFAQVKAGTLLLAVNPATDPTGE
jgi:hypothetical protein